MALQCSLSEAQLAEYTAAQLNHLFPDPEMVEPSQIRAGLSWVLERLSKIHRSAENKYYFRNGEPFFDHLHGDQYATYVYLFSRYCAMELNNRTLATKLYLLNRALFGVDIYFEVNLPKIFLLCHPAGSVLGRAEYQDYLVIHQNCTVGGIDNIYPKLGWGVVLCSGASVLGKSSLGDAVCVGAGGLLIDLAVPANHTVVGRAKEARFFPTAEAKWRQFFNPVLVSR